MMPLYEPAVRGNQYVMVQSTRRFAIGDAIVLRRSDVIEGQTEDWEIHYIKSIDGLRKLILCNELQADWPLTTGYVQKLVGFQSGNTQFLKGIYLGDPAVIPQYPAITIDAKSRTSEWMTLESTREKYDIDITVYIDGLAYYESQYELMHMYVQAIEKSLFRSFYPLVKPYVSTTLTADVNPGDMTLSFSDVEFPNCGKWWVFLESNDYLEPNRIKENLGNGTVQLQMGVRNSFSAGDLIIQPRRHIFNTLPAQTNYGTVNKNTVLKAGRISYFAEEEIRRGNPFYDPLIL